MMPPRIAFMEYQRQEARLRYCKTMVYWISRSGPPFAMEGVFQPFAARYRIPRRRILTGVSRR